MSSSLLAARTFESIRPRKARAGVIGLGYVLLSPLKCRRATSWILLAGWTAAIVLAVVPMGRYRDRPAWQQVAWIPFVSWPVTLDDTVRNVLLYVPFGYLQASAAVYSTAWRAVALATALSAGTEATQVYSRGRYPSTTDIVCNVIGAMMGFVWARRRVVIDQPGHQPRRRIDKPAAGTC